MKKLLQTVIYCVLILGNSYFCSALSAAVVNHVQASYHKIKTSPVVYYIHPITGDDSNAGTSKKTAFKTLQQIEKIKLNPGDKILLASNQVYEGCLRLINQQGQMDNPIVVTSVSWNNTDPQTPALINFKSWASGILIQDCSAVHVSNIRLTADGFEVSKEKSDMRCGVLINNINASEMNDIQLDRLLIKDVYYENSGFVRDKNEVQSANGTQRYGWGIRVMNTQPGHQIRQVQITNCSITDVSHTGIKLTGNNKNIREVRILDNTVKFTGGPGMQMSEVLDVYVANNLVDHSGSSNDSRKWGRGSGLWTWGSSNVMIEKNSFLYANGPGDSDGAHIDYNCDNIIIQYNLSAYNAGGFCEILGNNFNCMYRYNISINDGYRIKGKDGAFQEGKILWLSGYQGNNKNRKGPVNSYIYNNTIYTEDSLYPKIAFDNTSKGILIANNIFCLKKPFKVVQGDQYKPDMKAGKDIEAMQLQHNLFLNADSWPDEMMIKNAISFFGDPSFKKPGGLSVQDYIPLRSEMIRNKGIRVSDWNMNNTRSSDSLQMKKDILGNPIPAQPSIGAIEPVSFK
jgi:hypothetical protein